MITWNNEKQYLHLYIGMLSHQSQLLRQMAPWKILVDHKK